LRLSINLQGHVTEWTAVGAASFLGWLADQPWRGGGICALHCRDDAPQEALFDAIATSAHAVNRGSARLRVEWLDQEPGAVASPVRRLKSLLSVDETLPHYEGVRALGRELSAFNFLLVFSTHAGFEPAWWSELHALAELLVKHEPSVGLCAVAMDPRRVINSVADFDFLSMYPFPDVLSDPEETDASRWRRYLHHRIAWEAGGSISAAYLIDEHVRGVRSGDDADLESRLGTGADSLLASKGVGPALLAYLAHVDRASARLRPSDSDVAEAELLSAGALWRPPLSGALNVAAWASRAVLRSGSAPHSLARLRSNLVCAPLRGEIFQLCQRAEGVVRQLLANKPKRGDVPQSSRQALDRLVRGEEDYLHYPSGYPRPPIRAGDEWTFATLGEYLHAHQYSDVLDNHRKLLGLRNVVAHGHYTTWKHVQMVVGIRSALAV